MTDTVRIVLTSRGGEKDVLADTQIQVSVLFLNLLGDY